jgi:sterol desaturase/sphingolipid hydroxylase (fatty acid hydroxylase superfamily)
MDWIADIGQVWLRTSLWLLGLGGAFGILVRLMPCNPGMYPWKNVRGLVTDAIYWFIMPMLLSQVRVYMVAIGIAVFYAGAEPDLLPVKDWPIGVQCVVILLLQDFILYWIHRAFHSRLAWSFHAVHHSPHVLDWMSTMRTHPVNYVLEFTLADAIVLLLGFSVPALLALAAFNTVYSSMVHANLNWTFGPLRYVFASPVFHRWHHTTQEAGLDKNFASTFPFLDVLFGTFFMPPGKLPEQFGNGDADFPEDFLGQMLYPLRRTKPAPPAEQPALRPSRRRRVA